MLKETIFIISKIVKNESMDKGPDVCAFLQEIVERYASLEAYN